jgi:REP element-mobilizing transposase RayT
VTVCTKEREKLFVPRVDPRFDEHGVNKKYILNEDVAAGLVPAHSITNIVQSVLVDELPERFNVDVDFYVFMSDHLHVILSMGDHKGRSYTLGHVIGAFKSISTRELWKLGFKGTLFQPNYYEHVIRNEKSLDKIRRYILNNPIVEYQEISWKVFDPE